MLEIVVHFDYPPIPYRGMDYSAVTTNYEGGDGYDEPGDPIGRGPTAADAIDDLIMQIREEW